MTSARNGRIGASIRVAATRASCSVANAAARSALSVEREKRRRDRRRYQVDSPSRIADSARLAPPRRRRAAAPP